MTNAPTVEKLAKVIDQMRADRAGDPNALATVDQLCAALAKFDSDVADLHARLDKIADEGIRAGLAKMPHWRG
jgi:hypothetical protein